MKHVKKVIALSLLLALFCNPAFAYDSTDILITELSEASLSLQPRASSQIKQYVVSLQASGDDEMVASYMIYGMSNPMIEIGAYSIKIQRLVGSRWQTVRTEDGTSSTDSWSHGQDVYFTTTPGTTYRAVIELFATNSSGTDTRSATTPTATAK